MQLLHATISAHSADSFPASAKHEVPSRAVATEHTRMSLKSLFCKRPSSTSSTHISEPFQNPFLLAVWIFTMLFWLMQPGDGFSQQRDPRFYEYPQNHLSWYTIESPHFLVHFQAGNSRPAKIISRIAEEIYPDVTALYDYEPDTKISIVLNDRLDYANGAAFFLDNKIEIWLPALDSPLRGTHNWLRNVITHEFVHIIQIQATMKGSRRRPITYLQWLSYEDVRRPDVLYGFPSGVISYPLSTVGIPAWLAEGTAQYQRSHILYDYWDSHRDMILRTRVLDGSQLSLEKMGTFASKTSIEREVTYNQGFAFTHFLSATYGEGVLNDLSRAFSKRGVFDVSKALQIATGLSGHQVYNQWVASLHSHYETQTSGRTFTPVHYTEPEGFFNFFPTPSPDGTELAYLSNRRRDDSRVQLYIRNLKTGEQQMVSTGGFQAYQSTGFTLSCGLDLQPEVRFIQNAFSFTPNGRSVLYNRIRETRFGEPYNDIYLFDRETGTSHRLTHGARIIEPAVSPDGNRIAALIREDGVLNLILLEIDSLRARPLVIDSVAQPTTSSDQTGTSNPDFERVTTFARGEQLFRPVWHPDGTKLVYGFAESAHRSIRMTDLSTGSETTLLADERFDYRDPFVSNDGLWLYFSSDRDGIFNIYRVPFAALNEEPEQLTSVLGGAFMPAATADGTLHYALYEAEGYKLARLSPEEFLSRDALPFSRYNRPYTPHGSLEDLLALSDLSRFDDTNLQSLPDTLFGNRRLGQVTISIPTTGGADERTFYPYEDTFTSFSIYPAIRFDNYSKVRGSNADLLTSGRIGDLGNNIWRDAKIGMYFASREMIDRLTLFGGVLIGPGSNDGDEIRDFVQPAGIMAMDRDVFLMAEYRGLPFIKRSWSPTVSIELFNIRRNVNDGLTIEEFPCTACLPDTTSVGIAYDIWQAQVSLVSKLNRFTLVELGWHHSPYRVSTKSFFSREFRQTISGSSARYFIGNTYTAAMFFQLHTSHRHSDIVQRGITSSLRYSHQPSRLLDGYDIRGGELLPRYNDYRMHSVELDTRYGFSLFPSDRLFDVRTRFYTNFNGSDEYFFLDYIGGLPGMRSYSFFALGGNTTVFAQLNYHQPLFERIHRQVGRFTIDKLFARFFAETGNGWGGPLGVGNQLKSGLGAELRLSTNSYYLFPSRFFLSAAWGLDQFDVNLPESFITTTGQSSVRFGREVLFNFGLLFDFDF
jgi:Tol biopolymer transport system component